MTDVTILCAERSRRASIIQLCDDYLHRLQHYNLRATVEECPPIRRRDQRGIIAEQTERLLRRLRPDDYVIVLDERGRHLTSEDFAQHFEQIIACRARRVVFIIGGAYGIGHNLHARADVVLSLSRLTLPHELARLVLCEQLYRAMTILRGEPYHHGSTDE